MGNWARSQTLLHLLDHSPSWLSSLLGFGSGLGIGVILLEAGKRPVEVVFDFAFAIGFFVLLAWSGQPVLAMAESNDDLSKIVQEEEAT